jgi:hypothetical protein
MVSQFVALERRTAATGRDQVSHPRNGEAHDDLVAAIAGSLALSASKPQKLVISTPFYSSRQGSYGGFGGGVSSGLGSADWSNNTRFS